MAQAFALKEVTPMNENKICPLFLASPAFETAKGCECRKEKCAWWVEDKQKCAIAVGGERNRGK